MSLNTLCSHYDLGRNIPAYRGFKIEITWKESLASIIIPLIFGHDTALRKLDSLYWENVEHLSSLELCKDRWWTQNCRVVNIVYSVTTLLNWFPVVIEIIF